MREKCSGVLPCFVLLFFFLFFGCAIKPRVLVPNYVPPQKVAVLPMTNQSNDLRGPEYVRQEFVHSLETLGYNIQPISETDETLRTKYGITEGGQLGSLTPDQIGKVLGVEAIIYCDLIDFKFINIGVYQNKFVEANFRMVDPKTGTVLWEDQRKASRKQIQTDMKEATKTFARGLAERALGNMLNLPLEEQVRAVVRRALSTLPRAR